MKIPLEPKGTGRGLGNFAKFKGKEPIILVCCGEFWGDFAISPQQPATTRTGRDIDLLIPDC